MFKLELLILKGLILGLTVSLLLSFTACKRGGGHANAVKKPNVLILFSDQHNKKVMGYENHPDVISPNLDKLASEGLVFDRPIAP